MHRHASQWPAGKVISFFLRLLVGVGRKKLHIVYIIWASHSNGLQITICIFLHPSALRKGYVLCCEPSNYLLGNRHSQQRLGNNSTHIPSPFKNSFPDGIVRLLRHTYDSEKFASKLRVRDSKSSSNPNTIMPLFIYKIRLNPKPSRLILKVALYCHGAPMFNLNVVLTVLMSN